jgi:hypothetical protein
MFAAGVFKMLTGYVAFTVIMTSLSFPALVGATPSSCSAFPPFSNAAGGTMYPVPTIELWQGVVLIIGFGMFGLLVSILFLIVRQVLKY